jgi:hypothetical protein
MTQDEIIEITRQAGGFDATPKFLETFAELVAQREREACAKLCDEYDNGRYANAADLCATAIRARGQEGNVGIIRYADISVGKIIHNALPPQRTLAKRGL